MSAKDNKKWGKVLRMADSLSLYISIPPFVTMRGAGQGRQLPTLTNPRLILAWLRGCWADDFRQIEPLLTLLEIHSPKAAIREALRDKLRSYTSNVDCAREYLVRAYLAARSLRGEG